MKQNIIFSLLSLSSAMIIKKGVMASPCDCHQVNNWDELRTLIMSNALESNTRQTNLPLCPFNIGKNHNETTNHWTEVVYIGNPVHIYCKKEIPTDKCAITVTGDACGYNQNCGRQLFKVMSGKEEKYFITFNAYL